MICVREADGEVKILLKVPIINDKIKATVREEMIKAFGGNFKAVIVGCREYVLIFGRRAKSHAERR